MRSHPLPSVAAVGGGLSAPDSLTATPSSPALIRQADEQVRAKALVARLKDHIARIEETRHQLEYRRTPQTRSNKPQSPWRLGLAAVDAHLPEQGLARNALHDLAPAQYGDTPATMGFTLSLAIRRLEVDRRTRPILWCRSAIECQEHGKLYGHGLNSLGLHRENLMTLVLKKQISLFWVMEEALKSGCFSSVISDAASQQTDLTITRRFSLSASEGRSAGFLVFNRNHDTATASASRWKVAACPSLPRVLDPAAPGYPTWAVTLSRIRSGRPGHWTLFWHPQHNMKSSPPHHAPHHFSLFPTVSGRAFSPGEAEAGFDDTAQGFALRTG